MVDMTPDELLWAWLCEYGERRVYAVEIQKHPTFGNVTSHLWTEVINRRKHIAIDNTRWVWYITQRGIMHLQQDSGSV
jgi:hypothetical protein